MAKQLLFNINENKKTGRKVASLEDQVVKRIYPAAADEEELYNYKRRFYEHAKNRTEDSKLPKPEFIKNNNNKKVQQHSLPQACWSEAEPSGITVRNY